MIRTGRTSALTVLVVLVVTAAVSVAGVAASSSTALEGCQEIDQPGTYTLTENTENTTTEDCIEIDSGDVVLEGGGHTVQGYPGNDLNTTGLSAGNLSERAENVTVRNVTFTGWDRGVGFSFVNNSSISSVNVTETTTSGIEITGSYGVSLTDSLVTSNEDAVTVGGLLRPSRNVTVEANTIRNNNGSGIDFAFSVSNSTVEDNAVHDNNGTGISLLFGPSNNTVRENEIDRNDAGFVSFGTVGNEIKRNSFGDNRLGILSFGTEGQSIVGNVVDGSETVGVFLFDTFGGVVADNRVTSRKGARDLVQMRSNGTANTTLPRSDTKVHGLDVSVGTGVSFAASNVSLDGGIDTARYDTPNGWEPATRYLNFSDEINTTDEDVETNTTVEKLRQPYLDIEVGYDPNEVGNEADLSLWRREGSGWSKLDSTVDPRNNTVAYNATEAGVLAVLERVNGSKDGSGGGSTNPFFGDGGDALGELEVVDRLVSWSDDNEIGGVEYGELDLIDHLVEWNNAS